MGYCRSKGAKKSRDFTGGFNIDDEVIHPVFGLGVIININNDEEHYEVHFVEKDITRPISMDFDGLKRK
ncbi:hypothetical protein ACIQXG_06095 [Lysinibacillus sphaericus]|uniref:hypothetical protein n=1 Tax=Lysinibacillus sphaericus TaxID=1421 RepID=UPI0037FDEB2D